MGSLMFVAFVCTNGLSSSHSNRKVGLVILKFSFHSSLTTVCDAKWSHQALVLPGLVQNLLTTGELAALVLKICLERDRIVNNLCLRL